MQGKYFIRILKNLFHINKDRYVYKDKKKSEVGLYFLYSASVL